MDNYTLMKLSEKMDDDAVDLIDYEYYDLYNNVNNAESFKEKYKEFYTDIKLSHKEDW